MTLPTYTPCPGGFITTRTLDDGRVLVEGWVFTPTPWDGGEPRHESAYHWIATDEQDATATVAEFIGYLTQPLTTV